MTDRTFCSSAIVQNDEDDTETKFLRTWHDCGNLPYHSFRSSLIVSLGVATMNWIYTFLHLIFFLLINSYSLPTLTLLESSRARSHYLMVVIYFLILRRWWAWGLFFAFKREKMKGKNNLLLNILWNIIGNIVEHLKTQFVVFLNWHSSTLHTKNEYYRKMFPDDLLNRVKWSYETIFNYSELSVIYVSPYYFQFR